MDPRHGDEWSKMKNKGKDLEAQPLLTSETRPSCKCHEQACIEKSEDEWLCNMKKNMEEGLQPPSDNFPIYGVPTSMRQVLKGAYEPTTISIGPYHHHKQNKQVGGCQNNVQVGKKQKWQFLRELMRRNNISLKELFSPMKAMEAKTRRCYPEHIDLESHEFVEMMLLDGCFIIDFFCRKLDKDSTIWKDSICENPAIRYAISCELLFLENQLPFFVLQCLFDLLYAKEKHLFQLVGCPASMENLAVDYFLSRDNNVTSFFLIGDEGLDTEKIKQSQTANQHLLHFLQLCSIFQQSGEDQHGMFPTLLNDVAIMSHDVSYGPQNIRRIPCATKLQEAGMKFKKKENPRSILDVTYEKGVMELPPFPAAEAGNRILRNLVAMEQSFPSYGKAFTSRAVFMDFLIDTAKDAEILRDKDITTFESEKKMAKLVNDAFEGLSAFHSWDAEMAQLFGEVDRYYNDRFNTWFAKFRRDYLSSPWAIASLIAAIILLLLTIIQTLFTVYPYTPLADSPPDPPTPSFPPPHSR